MVVVGEGFTVWAFVPELVLKLPSPLYVAVSVLTPAVVEAKEQLVAGKVAVQIATPSLTVTVPVGLPAPGEFTVTAKLTV